MSPSRTLARRVHVGTGASSTQCEGAAPASDWWAWERAGHAPISGDGNGFATRYAEDFALLAGLGLTHHRLSIEWARIEPEPGRHDEAAVDHYRDVLTAARSAGVAPWVCLHHFTLPRWFAESGGFLVEENRTGPWARHVDFVAETFGDLVAGWQPVNETNYYADAAYGGRGWPPGHGDRTERAQVDEAIHLANAEAAVRLRQTGAPVSSIFGLSAFVAQDDDPATIARVDGLYERMWAPGLGLFRDGVLRVPGRTPVERADLAGAFDLIGFSYYSAIGVRAGQLAVHPPDAPRSPLGYGIWADGLGLVLDRLHAEVPGDAAARRRVRHRHGRRRGARRLPPARARGRRRRASPGHRRARAVPLDGGRQLRVAARVRRVVRDHRPRPPRPPERGGAPGSGERRQSRSGDVIEGIGELVRAAAVAALEVGVLVADVGDDRVALRFDLGADARLERHDRRVGVVGR